MVKHLLITAAVVVAVMYLDKKVGIIAKLP